MTTDCIDHLDIAAGRTGPRADRGEVTISPSEWGIVAIIAIGFVLMLPAGALLVTHLFA